MSIIAETGLYQYLIDKQIPVKGKVTNMVIKKGSQLYGPPQRYTPIYEVLSGAIKLGRPSPKGGESIYEIVTPGEFFGNLDMLGDHFDEFAKALAPAEIRAYDLLFFKQLITQDPMIAEWFYPRIVSRWNKTETLLAYIRSYDPRERITMLYLDMEKIIYTADQRPILLNRLLSFSDLADLTATTRQLVADTIRKLGSDPHPESTSSPR